MKEIKICPECGSDLECIDEGTYKGIDWETLQCPECEYGESDEPDWDIMPGGKDYDD